MAADTDRYQVVEHRLKDAQGDAVTLAGWLSKCRQGPTPDSWQTISFELWKITDIRVNPETLRRWHNQNNTEDQEEGGLT